MPSTQQQATIEGESPTLDVTDNAARMETVSALLGMPTEETGTPEKDAPNKEAEKSVSEALAEAEKPPGSSESNKTVKPPKTLLELSELTGIKVDDLYAIELPAQADGGENPTFGSLKDLAAQESDFAGRELQFEERRVKLGNEQAQARAELEIVLAALPEDAIKPEIMERARRERETMLDRELVRLVEVIPEWKNDDTKRAELAKIGEHLEQYGFEKRHAELITDHRMLRYMRDNFTRKLLVEKALATVKPVKPVPKGSAQKPAQKKAAPTVTPASPLTEQLAAIDTLIK